MNSSLYNIRYLFIFSLLGLVVFLSNNMIMMLTLLAP